jgi:ubiquinol-cytochrome c reductase cytochrome b subunit
MIARRIARFFDERFGSNAAVRYFMVKVYPDHWSFYLGEFALYSFALLVATGIWLTFAYVPSANGAYASVIALSRATPVGYLVRQVHHWSAVVFVAAILIHMARIFFTGAFRKPRELNWIVGFTMLVLASLTGFTGYSLPNDALSGAGVRIADSVALSVPLVGRWAADVLNGGGYPGPLLMSHFYTIHVYYLPIAIAGLLSLHLGMLLYQKHTQFERDPAHVVGRRFWPDYALRTLAAFAMSVAVVLVLASSIEINPIENYGPYHDWTILNPAAPDWYAAFLDGALRLGPSIEWTFFGHPLPAVFWPGVVLPTLTLALIGAWPWIDGHFTRDDRAHDVLVPAASAPIRTGAGTALILAGFVLTLAASDDQQSRTFHLSVVWLVMIYRYAFVVVPLLGGWIAMTIAREIHLRRVDRGREPERRVIYRRNAQGGFDEEKAQSI